MISQSDGLTNQFNSAFSVILIVTRHFNDLLVQASGETYLPVSDRIFPKTDSFSECQCVCGS